VQAVLELLKHCSSVHSTDNNDWSSLKIVSLNDHVEFVRFLLNLGVSVEITDNDARTPLRAAVSVMAKWR